MAVFNTILILIYFRVMLAGMAGRDAGLLADKVVLLGQDKLVQDMKESLGSDGETSDYQRSTPSPREDTDQRIKEFITEGNGFNKKNWIFVCLPKF